MQSPTPGVGRSQPFKVVRSWATARLDEYLVKGLRSWTTRGSRRAPHLGEHYFDELLARIRDILSTTTA
jgi:hypothetical protein